jgi:WD40 repeat protein
MTCSVPLVVVVPAGDHDRLAQQQLRLEDVLVIEAHRPVAGPQNLQFGSIGLFAWSPDNCAISTYSEDQTTCVWALPGGEKRRTLTGHTTAVTGVDWQLMRRLPAASSSSSASAAAATATTEEEESEWHEMLARCADDWKVMVWNARTWALMRVFDTSDNIHDWHTLTYFSRAATSCAASPRTAGTLLRSSPSHSLQFRTALTLCRVCRVSCRDSCVVCSGSVGCGRGSAFL